MTSSVLIVDDNEDNRCVLIDALEGEGYRLREATDGAEALANVGAELPDLVLLDVMMPVMDGIECCRQLQASDATRHIPIILVTALSADAKIVEGLEAGAIDYIAKPFVGAVVRARVRAALRTKLAYDEVRRSHEQVEQLASELEERNLELAELALRDGLTGLPNRVLLMDRVRQAHARAQRGADGHFALLFLDFDGFKLVNDSLGHEAGDELLKSIAHRLRHELRDVDTVTGASSDHMPSRLGGDEFVILLEQLHSVDDAAQVADRLQQALARPHDVAGQSVCSTASIGIVTSDRNYETADAMLRDADIAMYHAKEAGRACCVQFDDQMQKAQLARMQFERELAEALKQGRIVAAYQPVLRLSDGVLVGCEAIARWQFTDRPPLRAEEFMPFANEVGLVVPIGTHILTSAVRQLGQWHRDRPELAALTMTVNIWEKQLRHAGLVDLIADLLRQEGIEPSALSLDIPEAVFLEGSLAVRTVVDELRALGVRIAMDGCGRGRSVLAGLHEIPVDILRIDRTMVRNLDTRSHYAAVTHAVITLAHNLGMEVGAVGIESAGQLAQLQAQECDYGQGRIFADSLTPQDIEALAERDEVASLGATLLRGSRKAS